MKPMIATSKRQERGTSNALKKIDEILTLTLLLSTIFAVNQSSPISSTGHLVHTLMLDLHQAKTGTLQPYRVQLQTALLSFIVTL